MTIVITFGVAIFACLVGGSAIYATLGDGDRGSLRTLARHPLKSIFSEDAPDRDDDEDF
jgi:hypothetical protein